MSNDLGQREVRRGQIQGWLQTVVFFAAAAILGMVVYTSVLVQQDRRARELAATNVPLTATAQELLARRSTPVPLPQEAISPATAGRVAELSRWGQGGILEVAWSPDGRFLAVGTTIGVYLFDGVTLEQVRFLATSAPVAHLAFSPDRQDLAVGLSDRAVQLWQVADGTLRQTLADFRGPVRAVAYTPEGNLLVAGVWPTGWGVWTWHGGTVTELSIRGQPAERELWDTVPVAISADGRVLAAAGPDGTVRIWRLADGALLRVVQGEFRYAADPKTVSVLALSPDGQTLAYSLGGWVQVVWLDEGSGSPSPAYPPALAETPALGHKELERQQDMYTYGLSLAFSPDGDFIAAGSWDGTLWIWRLADRPGSLQRVIETGQGPVWGLAFSPDGVLAAGLPQAGRVEVRQPRDGSLLRSLLGRTSWLQSAAFFPNGQDLAVGGVDGRAELWRVAEGVPRQALPGEENAEGRPIYALRSLAVDPSGRLLAGGTTDGTVRLWDLSRGVLSRTLFDAAAQENPDARISPLLWVVQTSDGLILTSYYSSSLMRVDDGHVLASLVELFSTQVYLPSVESVAFSPDGQLLAAGSNSGITWLWDVVNGILLKRLGEGESPVRSVAFSPDGRLLATGSHDGAVRLWQVADRTLLRTLTGHQDRVRAVAFSPDGTVLASASLDGTVRLWRVDDGSTLRILDRAPATALAYSPDGRILAIGYSDGTIELLDETPAADGSMLNVLQGHTLGILSLSFSPDGTLLLSTSQDGTLRLWGVQN